MLAAVAVAGGCGAVTRYVTDLVVTRWGPLWLATLIVNLVGSALLGWAVGGGDATLQAILGMGFCGGFTTFSTACWQVLGLLGGWRGAAYAVGTAAGCLAAVGGGVWLAGPA